MVLSPLSRLSSFAAALVFPFALSSLVRILGRSTAMLSAVPFDETIVKLPHPYYTGYGIRKPAFNDLDDGIEFYQLCLTSSPPTGNKSHIHLHSSHFVFSELNTLKSSELPPQSNNSSWARAQRSPRTIICWNAVAGRPTIAHMWMLLYVLNTLSPDMETLQLELKGPDAFELGQHLKDVALAADYAPMENPKGSSSATADSAIVLAFRSTFWQGAGSPFGPQPAWCPDNQPSSLLSSNPSSSYPITPFHQIETISSAGDPQDPERLQHTRHPIRSAKPTPNAVIYSRWIPHLKENFSMIALDWQDEEHLRLFHNWQNDPRVSQGWNEAGTLEEHREYLRKIHHDPHQYAVLAKWDDTYFAYFEVYWAKEDRLGAYYDPGDFDRGRHSLVGDVRFRGPHRVSAWWSSLIHYLFLDDCRTMYVVGEPKSSNSTVVMYDLIHGFGLEKFVDLPHKRSILVRCHRERFFQLCPLAENEKEVGGMRIALVPKL